MHIKALIHMASALSTMSPEIRIIVFGSCSALCMHPELAIETEACMEMEEKWIVKTNRFLDEVVEAAWAKGYPHRHIKSTWQTPPA